MYISIFNSSILVCRNTCSLFFFKIEQACLKYKMQQKHINRAAIYDHQARPLILSTKH